MMERWTEQDIAMFAQAWTIELLMYFYRVWHVAPFAFVIFYAGLQTVNMDTLESAIIDGASRWERLRHVIVPHLMPLIIFIGLIHLMDCYRVFEEIVGFRSQAHVISLQWLTYDFLTPDDAGNRAISRASASAMLTMIGIVILLVLPLRRTWRDHKRGVH
jgi:multiple sugar transport system permease protein